MGLELGWELDWDDNNTDWINNASIIGSIINYGDNVYHANSIGGFVIYNAKIIGMF